MLGWCARSAREAAKREQLLSSRTLAVSAGGYAWRAMPADDTRYESMSRSQLAREIDRAARLTGAFTLRSGRTSSEYFDKYLFESDPRLLDALVRAMVDLVPAGTEVLAGLELGGLPIVTLLSRFTGLPAAFVRKQAKPYGTRRFAEGAAVEGRRVLVVEDVVTSGGQIVISTGQMRDLGAEIDWAVCAIDREQGGREALAESGIELHSALTRSDLERVRE
jgi:orotate phosphoribosyltransferase